MQDKRGQFFLIAAIVIIVITVSVLTISNYTQTSQATAIEDLGQEINIESGFVLDYGISQDKTKAEMYTLMEAFIDNYVENLESTRNIYFIFGGQEQIHFRGYQEAEEECACIFLNGGGSTEECGDLIQTGECIEAQISNETSKVTQNLSLGEVAITNVTLHLKSNDYPYTISAGQNFYFVIWENDQGEIKVVVSEE